MSSPAPAPGRVRQAPRPNASRIAAIWLAAAIIYLACEAITALAFPGYSYATNYISDLGVDRVVSVQGRNIDSPLHPLMNAGFILEGILFALGALLVTTRLWPLGHSPARRWFFIALALVHGIGIVMVGVFHGDLPGPTFGPADLHIIGAALAIVGGNLAIIVASSRAGRAATGLAPWVGITLGTIGLICLVMLEVDTRIDTITLLPDGVWERGAVYPIIVWEALAGVAMLRRLGGTSASARSAEGSPA